MHCSEIIDLNMAGVNWEINDVPLVKRESWKQTPQNKQTNNNIVPPVAPMVNISKDMIESMANRPTDLNALLRMISELNHPLRTGATNTVLPHIAEKPNGLLVITDLPSTDDDISGRILSGAAGELFDKMLNAVSMSRETVSILPLIFWRTPGGKTPTRDELDFTKPFVKRIINFIKPRIFLTLGTTSASEILGISLVSKHGEQINTEFGIPAIPIFHPNYLLLKPSAKRDVWTALQKMQNLLKNE